MNTAGIAAVANIKISAAVAGHARQFTTAEILWRASRGVISEVINLKNYFEINHKTNKNLKSKIDANEYAEEMIEKDEV